MAGITRHCSYGLILKGIAAGIAVYPRWIFEIRSSVRKVNDCCIFWVKDNFEYHW